MLVFADKNAEVPASWIDDTFCAIPKAVEHVQLKSVSTLVHNVDVYVAYKYEPF